MQGYMNVRDLAKMLLVKEATITAWCRAEHKDIPVYLIGGQYLFDYLEIKEWMRQFHSVEKKNYVKPTKKLRVI